MKKVFNFISLFISFLLIVAMFISHWTLYNLAVFSFYKFLIIISFVTLVVALWIIFLRKSKKIILKIIAYLGALIAIFAFLLFACFGFRTISFLKQLTKPGEDVRTYYVVVLKESNFNQIEDLENKQMLILNTEENELVINHLELLINFGFSVEMDLNEIIDHLLAGETDAVVIEATVKNLLDEEKEDFEESTKIIYQFDISKKSEIVPIEVDVTTESFIIFISGVDNQGSINRLGRSDVNLVMVVNPKTHKILLVSIPRDYYVSVHGEGTINDKLAHAGIYGTEKVMTTVANLLEIEINYYVKANFSSVIDVVDTIGGITVNSQYQFSAGAYSFTKGLNRVDGEQALAFVRHRKTLPGGDRGRGVNHQAFVAGLIKEVTKPSVLLRYNSFLTALEDRLIFNMSYEKILELIQKQIDKNIKWEIINYNLNGFDASDYTYTSSRSKRYVMVPDLETVEEAQRLIKEMIEE